jgi:lysophospholipase L1-like esterase
VTSGGKLAATGGTTTNAGGQANTGGNGTGGSAAGGAASGGSMTDAGVMGGAITADAGADGKTNTGGTTAAPDGAATGGKTTTGGTASGGTAAGGATATGGTPPGSGSLGSSDGKTPITVWMSGDSTMAGGTSCSSCPCGWGTQFGSVFNSNVTIANSAISGRSIKTWLYDTNVSTKADASGECILTGTTYSAEWNAMLDANKGMKPGDYLFIEFGINDGSDCSKARHVGIELFKTYLTTMAKAASDRGAQAIFLTPTNMIGCTGSTAQTNTRGQYPAATIAAGTAANVPVIDVTTLSAALYTSAGLCPNSGSYTSGVVGAFFCNDHTHFEKAGALQIAQMVGKALKDQGIGLASYLVN